MKTIDFLLSIVMKGLAQTAIIFLMIRLLEINLSLPKYSLILFICLFYLLSSIVAIILALNESRKIDSPLSQIEFYEQFPNSLEESIKKSDRRLLLVIIAIDLILIFIK